MAIILGIESTAHTFGVGIVRNGKILANVGKLYKTKHGGIIPMEAAKHHEKHKKEVYNNALKEAKIKEHDIQAIAFSQGPGLAPCLIVGKNFAKTLGKKLNIALIPANHCVAHLEIGGSIKPTSPKDPVMLYASGANTQIIAYASGKYRIFGETLDIGIGNFIDNFARHLGIGFPGGPEIEKIARTSKKYIELPYSVKGMDISLSGTLTNLKQKIDKMNLHSPSAHSIGDSTTDSAKLLRKNYTNEKNKFSINNILTKSRAKRRPELNQSERSGRNYTPSDLAYSMQETVFAMLVEVSERALAHTGKDELLLGGGVACNKRLQEMCRIMCKERGARFFVPENSLLVDNGAMMAFLGEIMFKKGIAFKAKDLDKIDIKPRERTDDVEVEWK